jgi:8-oxo-dGTP diphosphatase
MVTVVVDGANVVGSRPDGWWRDRAGAAARLYADLVRVAGRPVVVPGAGAEEVVPSWVLMIEGAARAAPIPAPGDAAPAGPAAPAPAATAGPAAAGPVRVVRADRSGDDAIVALVADLPGRRVVVTADRELRRRCEAAGAEVAGPAWLLNLLGR